MFGVVEARDAEFVKKTLEESYLRLEPHDVVYVGLNIFATAVQMKGFFARERASLAIPGEIEDTFVAQHDAWRGTPRISVCLERLRALPEEAQVGNLRHEAAHSLLHGSIEYYMMPPSFHSLVGTRGFTSEAAAGFLYLVSIAVKDFEASRLLVQRGCFKDQVAYVTNLIGTSGDERLAWEMARGNQAAEMLCIASRLKEVCCAAPLLCDERVGDELEERIVGSLSYLGGDTAKKLLWIAKHDLPELGEDTMKNVDTVAGLLLDEFSGY